MVLFNPRELNKMASRVVATTPGITKRAHLDLILYVRGEDYLESLLDHFALVSDVCACHSVRLSFIEDEYRHSSYILSRMFNFDYATGEGFPPEAITAKGMPWLAGLGLIAQGNECHRCWNLHDGEDLCPRCETALEQMEQDQ